MTLRHRIRRLEESQGLDCPECGHRSGEPVAFDLSEKYADWHGHPEVIPTRTCRQCGAVKSFSLNFEFNDLPQETVQALMDCGAIRLRQDAQDAF